MSSLNAKLEPCPFCGSDAEVERRGTARASMIVACTHCGARVESGDVYGLTHHDQWAWNRRAATRQEAEATEGECPHNCDEGGICLAELSGYPGSCPRPLKETNGKWLLVKRGLYERPDHMGYTGIRDNAGLYSEDEAKDTVRDGSYGVSMIRYEDAPDYTDACFDDLARKHYQDKVKALRSALRAALRKAEPAKPVADLRNSIRDIVRKFEFGSAISEHVADAVMAILPLATPQEPVPAAEGDRL